jgi:predicted transcriptional regulator
MAGKKKAPRGRISPATDTQDVSLTIRISPALKTALEAAAVADERSISRVAVRALERAMREEEFLK